MIMYEASSARSLDSETVCSTLIVLEHEQNYKKRRRDPAMYFNSSVEFSHSSKKRKNSNMPKAEHGNRRVVWLTGASDRE